jgi:hypothetical protein
MVKGLNPYRDIVFLKKNSYNDRCIVNAIVVVMQKCCPLFKQFDRYQNETWNTCFLWQGTIVRQGALFRKFWIMLILNLFFGVTIVH